MKKLSETLTELGIAFAFPICIQDTNGCQTYLEEKEGFWYRAEHDDKGNRTFFENSEGYSWRAEYNAEGDTTYFEESGNGKSVEI